MPENPSKKTDSELMQSLNKFSNQDIDVGNIFRVILMQSKILIGLVIIGTAIGVWKYIFDERVYQITSLVQFQDNNKLSSSNQLALDLYSGDSDSTDTEVFSKLYKSRTIILSLIEKLQLNLTSEDGNLSIARDYIEEIELKNNSKIKSNLKLIMTTDGFSIIENEIEIAKSKYGSMFENNQIKIQVDRPSRIESEEIEFSVYDPTALYKKYSSKFSIRKIGQSRNLYAQSSGLFEISFKLNDRDLGVKVLDEANSTYINKNIQSDTDQARKAINFIDETLGTVKTQLDLDKLNLREFQESSKTIDVNLQVQSILTSIADIENKLKAADIEIAKASSNYTETNPIYLEILDKKNVLLAQKAEIENSITSLPVAQQEYIDLYRDVELSDKIYQELLDRRLEYSIREASTLGNIRVVDTAYVNYTLSPTLNIIIFSFIISLFLSLLFVLFRGFFLMPISNPAEIADNNIDIPILSVIPLLQKGDEESERFAQSIESLVVNVNNLSDKLNLQNAVTILFTSASAGNGKSYTSREFARKMASLGKKTILIDNDFKRGDQHKEVNLRKITREEFVQINDDNIENLRIENNFYVVPKISRLPSSFQFLYSEDFSNKLNYFKENFDCIVIDTPPLLSVSDTSILLSHSDVNIFVARHGLTKINEIKQALIISGQVGIAFDGIVYNAYQKPSSYYGYYNLYGNYAYQYYAQKYLYNSYEYEKKD